TKRRGLCLTPDVSYHADAMRTRRDRALRLIEKMGIARPRDLETHGVTRAQLSRLVREGRVLRRARGIYVAAGHAPTAAHTLAQTVADCFKYRNKVGIDVAVEALRDFSRKHRGGATELARFARICRVSRVMQPYLDAIA